MEKYRKLKEYFKGKITIVSYSGGMDSLLVSLMSKYHSIYTLALTINNGFFLEDTINRAVELAKKYDINHKVVNINYLKNRRIISQINKNLDNRCYICKRYMAEALIKERDNLKKGNELNNIPKGNLDTKNIIVVDGTNYDDLFEDRPGIRAYREYNIRSPLAELKIVKRDVRDMLNYMKVPIPKEDSCLATRILNPPINEKKLKMVNEAEDFLNSFLKINGYLRVRLFHDIGIIEVNRDEIYKIVDIINFEIISKKFKNIGFKKCTLRIDNI